MIVGFCKFGAANLVCCPEVYRLLGTVSVLYILSDCQVGYERSERIRVKKCPRLVC